MPMHESGPFAYYTKSPEKVPGKDRKGFRGGSLLRAFASGAELDGHLGDRDPRLIEGLKIVGADELTARDEALYQLMLHVAREAGFKADGYEREDHQVDVANVWSFLESREKKPVARRLDRLHDSIVRLTRTVVRYSHRDHHNKTYGATSLVTAEIHEDLSSGAAVLHFTLPPAVRHAIMSGTEYTWLELEAFAGFNSRYAPRLYQRLALGAGMDGPAGKRWQVAPLELARLLNYPVDGDTLHFASFERRALKPAMEDIAREVRRFRASYKKVPGKGRGKPVAELVFEVTPASVRFQELKAADVGVEHADHTFRGSMRARSYPETYLPSRLFLGKAVTLTKADPEDILERWLDALDRAEADPEAEIVRGLCGQDIMWQIAVGSKDTAFADFVVHAYNADMEWHKTKSVPAPVPPSKLRARPAPRPVPLPVPAAALPVVEQEQEPEVEPGPDPDVFDDLDDDDIEPPPSFYRDEPQPTGEFSDDIPF